MKRMSIFFIIVFLVVVGYATGLSAKTKPNPSYIDSNLRTFSREEAETIIANYHKDPITYYQDMADVLFYQLNQKNPLLAKELGKLPEFQDRVSPSEVEALENIVNLYNLNKSNFENVFQQMYKVGIPEVRKFCTPLELLFNLAMMERYNENNNPIKNYDLYDFIKKVWGHGSPKGEFEEITSILNAPELIDIFEKMYFKFIPDGANDIAQHPERTLERKGGDCEDYGIFDAFCLEKGGYKAWVLNTWWVYGNPTGHSVALYKDPHREKKLYILNNAPLFGTTGGIRGPFKSRVEIGKFLAKEFGKSPENIWVYRWRTFLSNFRNFPFRESLI